MSEYPVNFVRSTGLLNRILDQPGLVEMVQQLEPEILTRLVRRIGLEDAAEIVAMATVDQLQQVFDEDLWYNDNPGEEEKFDAARFVLWLEVLQENGPGFAAEKVRQFDEDMLSLALSRYLLVLDHDALFIRLNHEEDPHHADMIDKAFDSSLCHEFGQFFVVSRNANSWEVIISLIAELNEIDYPMFNRLMARCANAGSEYIEDHGGLFEVLTSSEMLAVDVAADREERRQQRGYVTPSAARTFFATARLQTMAENTDTATWDYETRRYFRKLQTMSTARTTAPEGAGSDPVPDPADSRRFAALLEEAEILDPPRHIRQIEMETSDRHQLLISQAMQTLRAMSPDLYDQRLSEISYLSNVLIAGCPFQNRRFRPVEAAEAALATCQLGIEFVLGHTLDAAQPDFLEPVTTLLTDADCIWLFNPGWGILYENVVMTGAATLSALIGQVKNDTRDKLSVYELAAIMDSLDEKIRAGQPWLFTAESDDLLRYLDNDLLLPLMALMQEFPTLSGVLAVKVVESGSSLISSRRQIKRVETWLSGLLNKARTEP